MKYTKKYLCKVHHFSSYHRGSLELFATKCLCFYCKTNFTPDKINHWIDLDETALCPYCGIDSVIGNKNPFCEDFPIEDTQFIEEMNKFWFGNK